MKLTFIVGFFCCKRFLRGDFLYVDPMLYAAEELANAIIIKAVEDYRHFMKDLWLV